MSRKFVLVRNKAPKPSQCHVCKKDDQLSWSNGEWKCSRCSVVVEPD
jgi:ribosomal protein L37AE/L43A